MRVRAVALGAPAACRRVQAGARRLAGLPRSVVVWGVRALLLCGQSLEVCHILHIASCGGCYLVAWDCIVAACHVALACMHFAQFCANNKLLCKRPGSEVYWYHVVVSKPASILRPVCDSDLSEVTVEEKDGQPRGEGRALPESACQCYLDKSVHACDCAEALARRLQAFVALVSDIQRTELNPLFKEGFLCAAQCCDTQSPESMQTWCGATALGFASWFC